MKHAPTDEQAAVIAQARASESLMIQAYAGCAKTSTLEMFAPRVQVPSLALAFNKRIADELRPRLPGTFEVKTLNGLGHGAWSRALRGSITSVKLDDRKIGKLVGEIAKRQGAGGITTAQWGAMRGLAAAAMQAGVVPGDEGEPLATDTPETWEELALGVGISTDDFPLAYSVARETLVESIALARAGVICFDDQVYCPTMLGGQWPRFPLVAVDEAQDLSPLNHRMLELCSSGRLVAVGDSRQAIYAWRGADSESMQNLRRLKPGWTDLPLQMTFRCPKVVVARQQWHAPGFRAWEGCAEGSFRVAPQRAESEDLEGSLEGSGWGWPQVEGWLGELAAEGIPSPSVSVLCRNNAPLVSLAFKLIRQGIGPVMPGRDLGKGLGALVRKLGGDDEAPVVQVLGKLEAWESREIGNLVASGREHLVEGVQDRAECVRAVADGSQARTQGDLLAGLEAVFSRERGRVTLSSGHKAKGLEWDLVVHLDPWRVPSKWAKKAAGAGNPSVLEQEWNLLYVIETRTKRMLVNANLEDFR